MSDAGQVLPPPQSPPPAELFTVFPFDSFVLDLADEMKLAFHPLLAQWDDLLVRGRVVPVERLVAIRKLDHHVDLKGGLAV